MIDIVAQDQGPILAAPRVRDPILERDELIAVLSGAPQQMAVLGPSLT